MKKGVLSRIISFTCAFSMLAACLPVSAAEKVSNPKLSLPQPEALAMKDGTLSVEAENVTFTDSYVIVDDKNASNNQGIKPSVSSWRQNADPDADPDVSVSFKADKSGSGYVWARMKTPNTGADSIHVDVMGKNSYSAIYMSVPDPAESYHWVNFGTTSLKAGENTTIMIQYRELNATIDRIVVTDDPTFEPSGMNDMPGDEGTKVSYEGLFPEPDIKPIAGHPRLWFTKEDIPKILANCETDIVKPYFEKTIQMGDTVPNGMLDMSKVDNYSSTTLSQLQNRALLYALGLRDKDHARVAVDEMKNYLSTVLFNPKSQDITRQMGVAIMTAAAVYDWCYDIMTEEDKQHFIKMTKVIARQKEIGYPPTKQSPLSGHSGEGEIFGHLISAGIAYYDEDPEIYDLAAGRMFSEFIDARVMWNKTGTHPIGLTYGTTRYAWELLANMMFIRMGYEEGILGEFKDLARVAQRQMYTRLPSGYYMKWGDDWMWSGTANTSWYWTNYSMETYNLVAEQSGDPYVTHAAMIDNYISGNPVNFNGITLVPAILIIDPDIAVKTMDNMPLANKTDYPLTSIQARTNWVLGLNSNAAIATLEGREKMIKDHNHADIGSFQLYYKGNLAINAGTYAGSSGGWGCPHFYNYYTRTIAHNCMTIYDPSETFYVNYHEKTGDKLSNDGGQINPQGVGTLEKYLSNPDEAETMAWYIGPNKQTPEYSFIKTDLTNAYGNGKAKKHQRSMVFMDLDNNDYPAALIVYDDVESSDASFRKAWIMNTQLEPEVNGDITTVIRNDNGNNGKLVNKTFLPVNPEITKVGGAGKESWVDGVNYESKDNAEGIFSEQGQWRFEISPSSQSKKDHFLNSMYVTDYDRNLPQLDMYQEETDKLYGVTLRDRAVYFPKERQVSGSFNVTLRDNGFEDVKVLITDIKKGTWKVTSDADGSSVVYKVNDDENTLYFRGKKGVSYTATMSGGTPDEISYEEMNKPKYGDFMVYDRDNRQFYPFMAPTMLRDGKYFVPLRTLFETQGRKVGWDNGVVTVEGKDSNYRFTEGSTAYTKEDVAGELSAAPFVENGTMYINIDDIDMFRATYDPVAKILAVTNVARDYTAYEEKGFKNYVIPVDVKASGNDGNVEHNMFDSRFNTRWSSDVHGSWAIFEFAEVNKLKEIAIAFYSGKARATMFKLEVSTDGENFTEVYNGQSSGTTDEPESFKFAQPMDAKYVRVTGYGNTKNPWNSIAEVIFLKED